jgi:hypothetical protein
MDKYQSVDILLIDDFKNTIRLKGGLNNGRSSKAHGAQP